MELRMKKKVKNKESKDLQIWWPFEKEIFFQPERMKYIRRAKKPEECVFCKAYKSRPSQKNLMLYKSKMVMVLLNKYPYNNGHLLVLPASHCGDLEDLENNTYLEAMMMVKKTVSILKKEYRCQGLNIGMNHGAVSGAGIPGHLHWHVIPRWLGDTNFFPLIAETKVLPESVEQMYKRLKPYFVKL
jgi:ATP adenylyltransferase